MLKPEISFEYYFNEYCGGCRGVLDKEAFDKYITPAFREIKGLCGCAKGADLNRPEVLQCACEVAEKLYLAQKTGNVKREDIDGYSVTYSDSAADRNVKSVIMMHLADTGLLYAGVE